MDGRICFGQIEFLFAVIPHLCDRFVLVCDFDLVDLSIGVMGLDGTSNGDDGGLRVGGLARLAPNGFNDCLIFRVLKNWY